MGEESDADERHCAALCDALGVELEVVHALRQEGEVGNLQAWARDLRYAAAMKLAERGDALVAAGHTASDQVETILYRLAASPGRRALLGMRAAEGRLVRPLLGVTRAQTAEYCEARGLEWREDASNESEEYARVRVRGGLVPALRAVHPAAEANVLRTASLLREETELLDGLVADTLEGGREHRAGAPGRAGDGARAPGRREPRRGGRGGLRAAGGRSRRGDPRAGPARPPAGGGGRLDLHVGGNVSAVVEDGRLSMIKLPPR